MAQPTEAACLLVSGVLYGKRVLLEHREGDPIFAGFKAGAFSLYHGDAPIYHFDLEGRWQRAFLRGIHYLKGLDTNVQSIDRVREGENLVLKRGALSDAETSELDATIRGTAAELIDGLDAGRFERIDPPLKGRPLPVDELRAFLNRIVAWDAEAWRSHRETFQRTYGPMPLLPPDSLNAVVLQATLGHARGSEFGGGAGSRHGVRSPDEFESHARDVAALLGRRVAQCRNVFLAGADALRRPVEDVSSYLGSVSRWFPIDPSTGPRRPVVEDSPTRLDGVHAFLDDFRPPVPDAEAFARWRTQGLTRVTLGIESGEASLRARYGKDWADDDFASVVARLKTAGIGVGVIVLAGAGGPGHADRHVEATAALLESVELGVGDLISLIDARELDTPLSNPGGEMPLVGAGLAAHLDAFKSRLAPLRAGRKVKVTPYSPGKQASF